jgi:hypothetical protein
MNDSRKPDSFTVDSPSTDGAMRMIATFGTREEAEAAAALLRQIGAQVVVRGPDENE